MPLMHFFFVGRAVHRDVHFDDVRVNVFFPITGAGDVGFDKEQKNILERPGLRDHPFVEPAVLVLVKGDHSFSHDVVKGERLTAVVNAGFLVCQCLRRMVSYFI